MGEDKNKSIIWASVVVPTYNQEQYIEHTIMSIVRQKCNFNFEIIVVDDCSNDGTYVKCMQIAVKYPGLINLYKNETNLGLLGNFFNALMPKCHGSFIAVCAGDDIWNDEYKLQKQVDYLIKHPDCSCVHTGSVREFEINGEKVIQNTWTSPLLNCSGKKMAEEVIKENFSAFPVASSMMYRTEILDDYKLFISEALKDPFVRGEAMILFPIFAITGKFFYLPEPMVTYRVREESASHFTNDKQKEKFKLFYLFQKLNTVRLLHLSSRIKLYLNLKLIKCFLVYSIKSTNNELKSYLLLYRKGPTYNLYPGVDLLIKLGLAMRKDPKERK